MNLPISISMEFMYLLEIIRTMYFLMLRQVRHSIMFSIFQKITNQVRIGIIHICINFLMDKFRQVCLGLFIVEGLEKLLPEPLQNITQHTIAMRDFPFDNLFVTTDDLSNTMTGHESLTVNGEVNPTINITSGETQLMASCKHRS